MLGAFGENTFETEFLKLWRQIIAVDKLAVAEHLGRHAEESLEFLAVAADLFGELLGVDKRRQGICVRLGDELHTASVGQTAQQVDEFRHILLELLYSHT